MKCLKEYFPNLSVEFQFQIKYNVYWHVHILIWKHMGQYLKLKVKHSQAFLIKLSRKAYGKSSSDNIFNRW